MQDQDTFPPDEDGDDNLFLVNYHRDFDVRRNAVIKENDIRNWYRQDFEDYKDDPMDENETGVFPFDADYHIFPLSCLSHSGIWLSLHHSFPCDSGGWDTSHVGAVLVAKSEWADAKEAYETAAGLVETWNQYLSGDVYGIVRETYDKDKQPLDYDSCWGFYGSKYALKELETYY